MRMGLACFNLRQFMVVGQLSITIADGPVQHIKACDSGPDFCHSSCPPWCFMAVASLSGFNLW